MFHSSQHGFRKNKTTVIQLLTFLQTAYKSQDKASDMETVFTDFSEALLINAPASGLLKAHTNFASTKRKLN